MPHTQDPTAIAEIGAHNTGRLLIASYFIGAATGVIPFESGRVLAAILTPDALTGPAFSFFVFTCAYLILIGRQVRAAALLLALFVFWSSYMASFGPLRSGTATDFWRDLVLISTLLLTYVEAPRHGGGRIRIHRRQTAHAPITPRRVMLRDEQAQAKPACEPSDRPEVPTDDAAEGPVFDPVVEPPADLSGLLRRVTPDRKKSKAKPKEVNNLFNRVFDRN